MFVLFDPAVKHAQVPSTSLGANPLQKARECGPADSPLIFRGVQCSMQFINPKILVDRSHYSFRFRMGHAKTSSGETVVEQLVRNNYLISIEKCCVQ
mmetsp:Transcript_73161/g.148075  ORF Transcript_73161/g.148075 Transcript_73161/m.148075 type:complete len:97 (-) Transcript_73161:168-458(-)